MHNLAIKYPDLKALQESADWRNIPIRERLGIISDFKQKKELSTDSVPIPIVENVSVRQEQTFSLNITLDKSQLAAIELVKKGVSFVITGAAGTGKTTLERAIFKALLDMGHPARHIAIGALTRVATGNTRKALARDTELFKQVSTCIQTLHKHLEFKPEYYEDIETGKNKMRFVETRNENRPFSFKILNIDEAPMCDLLLYEKLYAAMLPGTIVIFIGDINQLPPVFGKSIFNFALHQLPVIELTKIYRQADDSGVLQNAWNILDGKIPVKNKDTEIIWWDEVKTKKMSQSRAGMALGKAGGFFQKRHIKGDYDPLTDAILSPWNEQEMGTKAMNNWIAQFMGDERKVIVHEIIAGRRNIYLAKGDLILVDKNLCIITNIMHNPGYAGRSTKIASENLLRTGFYRAAESKDANHDIEAHMELTGYADINVDDVADDERKNQASAIITYKYAEKLAEDTPDEEYQLQTAGDFSPAGFSLGYVTTCHKAQGSEWRKVFILLHEEHATKGSFVSREWIYTATTRAREKICYIATEKILQKAVDNQIIRGKTLEEKIAHINAKATVDMSSYPVIKPGEWAPLGEPDEIIIEQKKPALNMPEKIEVRSCTVTDFQKYVPLHVKELAKSNLIKHWDSAKRIWGDVLGDYPSLTFDCQRGKTIGLAIPKYHQIKLNPIYLSAKQPELYSYICNETVIHEICHLITARYVNMTGHGKDWEMAMRLMQQEPKQYYSGPMLPNWVTTARALMNDWTIVINSEELLEGEEE